MINNIQMMQVPPHHETSYCSSINRDDATAAAAVVQQQQQQQFVQMRIGLAHLNNHGAALVDSGDIDEGVMYLKQALQASKQLINSEAAAAAAAASSSSYYGGNNTSTTTCGHPSSSSSSSRRSTTTFSLDQLISIKTNNDEDEDFDDFMSYYNELNKTSATSTAATAASGEGRPSSISSSSSREYNSHPQGRGEEEEFQQDQGPFLFRRLIRIVPSSENVLDGSEATHLITTTIVFNLGIAIHQRSFSCYNYCRDDSDEDEHPLLLLKKAIQLYECALNTLVRRNNNKPTTTTNTNSTVFVGKEMMLLVILNNLTYAHSTLGNTIEVENIANYQLSSLMLVIDQSRVQQQGSGIGGNNNNNTNNTNANFLDCLFQSIHHYIYVANPTIAPSA